MPATWKKLAYEDDVPLLTLFAAAHTVLASNVANVAVGVAIGANSVLGRISGNIQSIDAANLRTLANVEEAGAAILKTVLAANGDMIYASAANTPANLAKGNAGQFLKMGAANAPEWGAGVGAFVNTANAATRANLTPTALGESCFQVDTLSCYVCTVLA